MIRREFLGKLGWGAVGAAGLYLAGEGISSLFTEGKEIGEKREIQPEYRRTMRKVLISMNLKHGNLGTGADTTDLIERTLPDYTEIACVVPASQADAIKQWFSKRYEQRSVEWIEVADKYLSADDFWTQDWGELVTIDGKEGFVVPMVPHKDNGNFNNEERDQIRNLHEVAKLVFGLDKIREADFCFAGGNLLVDQTPDGTTVFIGYDDVMKTKEDYRLRGNDISNEEIAARISRQFGGANVRIMGSDKQSAISFHLDQSFLLLEGKVAVVNELTGDAEQKDMQGAAQQRYYKEQLENAGYTVHTLHQEHFGPYQSVNALPFVDQRDGQKKIIYPVFGNELAGDYDTPGTLLTKERLKGKALEAYTLFEQLGYQPLPTRDFAYHPRYDQITTGSLHCAVLARE